MCARSLSCPADTFAKLLRMAMNCANIQCAYTDEPTLTILLRCLSAVKMTSNTQIQKRNYNLRSLLQTIPYAIFTKRLSTEIRCLATGDKLRPDSMTARYIADSIRYPVPNAGVLIILDRRTTTKHHKLTRQRAYLTFIKIGL